MAETLHITAGAPKEERYRELIPQIESLIAGEDDMIANLANVAAALAQAFGHLWTGFYLSRGDRLVLGPFQGPVACTSIALLPVARGVCGAAWARKETVIVPDVEKFPGHIACSSLSRSEIVVPLVHDGVVRMVLDVDSAAYDMFDDADARGLEAVMDLIRRRHYAGSAA